MGLQPRMDYCEECVNTAAFQSVQAKGSK